MNIRIIQPPMPVVTIGEIAPHVVVVSGLPIYIRGTDGQASQIVQLPAARDLGGHRAVIVTGGQADYANSANPSHGTLVRGITSGAVSASDQADIIIGGLVTEPSWNWNTATPVWVGTNGMLTQTPPSSGFQQVIGWPLTATSLVIEIGEPIYI